MDVDSRCRTVGHKSLFKEDHEQLRTAAMARTTHTTEILTLPALLLSVVDQEDPIKIGGEEIYTITVVNQGTGPDEDVQIVAHLPDQFEFIDIDGPTEAEVEGQIITFGAIEQLEPNDRVSWKLRARAKQEGDVQLRVELSSEYLSQPAISTEPTRLID
ncbi:hypothetical protein BH23PLA1_BH23PLA1_11390 [soil metagenome]